jgi:hypothetical protein
MALVDTSLTALTIAQQATVAFHLDAVPANKNMFDPLVGDAFLLTTFHTIAHLLENEPPASLFSVDWVPQQRKLLLSGAGTVVELPLGMNMTVDLGAGVLLTGRFVPFQPPETSAEEAALMSKNLDSWFHLDLPKGCHDSDVDIKEVADTALSYTATRA